MKEFIIALLLVFAVGFIAGAEQKSTFDSHDKLIGYIVNDTHYFISIKVAPKDAPDLILETRIIKPYWAAASRERDKFEAPSLKNPEEYGDKWLDSETHYNSIPGWVPKWIMELSTVLNAHKMYLEPGEYIIYIRKLPIDPTHKKVDMTQRWEKYEKTLSKDDATPFTWEYEE